MGKAKSLGKNTLARYRRCTGLEPELAQRGAARPGWVILPA